MKYFPQSKLFNGILAVLLLAAPLSQQPAVAAESMRMVQQDSFEILPITIYKSPNDQANYQAIRLANGMEVLLISDQNANKSLMSLALPIGAMEDPQSQQGLAHYLEHMILMGSEKYPETNGLDHFLNKNGGYNNASTNPMRTAYYLSVNNEAFDEAVDRLADAFVAPLLDESNAKREVNAINAEMVRAKSSDGHLLNSVNLATSNPAHPITKFAAGNLASLSDKPNSRLQEELMRFYQQYYSANLVKAVLYSNQSLPQMAQLAQKTLGRMANKKLTPPIINEPLYRAQDKSVWIDYKPIKPNKMLAVNFDLKNDENEFSAKSGEYLAYVFNNNGENTLSDYLMKNGLSDSGISAVPSANISRNRGAFTFYVSLTDKGVAQKEQIISLIFQQIDLVKQKGIQPSYFAELKNSLAQEFQHLQTEKSGAYVEYLADQMLSYPLEHILDAPYFAEKMDTQAIQSKLAQMTLDNARIIYINENAQTTLKTPHFEANYAVRALTQDEKSHWLDFTKNPAFGLPELNPYMATDFSLIEKSTRTTPMRILSEQGKAIYAMPSRYFGKEPKAHIVANLNIVERHYDIKSDIAADLLNYMNSLAQAKIEFQASVAGMESRVSSGANGVRFEAEGYTQHLQKLLTDSLTLFKTFFLTEELLVQAKERYLEALDRADKESSAVQAGNFFANFASFPYFEPKALRETISQITLADIAAHRTRLLSQADSFRLMSVGNYTDEQVSVLAKNVEEIIPTKNRALSKGRYVDIEGSERKLNFIKNVPHQDNAFSVVYMANGYEEIVGQVRARLLADILSRWYFNDLRTEQQLGYVVYAAPHKIGKTSGVRFLVQSPNATPKEIMAHNQRFFAESAEKLTALTEQEFQQYQRSLLEKLRYKPESLAQEFAAFKQDYLRDQTQFDLLARTISALESLNKADLVEFYRRAVLEQKGLTLVSQALATNTHRDQAFLSAEFELVESVETLQKTFPLKTFE